MSARHVVLVGLMGSGKTTVGRRAAKLLDRPFVDCDEAFVARTGRTIAEVFATDGEAGFRTLEADLVADLLAVRDPLLISTGGGAVTTPSTRAALADPAGPYVVWLRATPGFLAGRVASRSHRPLLDGADPREVLARLAAEREPAYAEVADAVLDVDAFHHHPEPAADGSRPPAPKRAMAARIAQLAGVAASAGLPGPEAG